MALTRISPAQKCHNDPFPQIRKDPCFPTEVGVAGVSTTPNIKTRKYLTCQSCKGLPRIGKNFIFCGF